MTQKCVTFLYAVFILDIKYCLTGDSRYIDKRLDSLISWAWLPVGVGKVYNTKLGLIGCKPVLEHCSNHRKVTQMSQQKPKLKNLSEILEFLRKNKTPIYFISPTPFSLLGIDQWVGNLEFINYFDTFDGKHRNIFIPSRNGPQDFDSMEDVANYLLEHPEFVERAKEKAHLADTQNGKALFVMFDERTEEIAKEVGMDIALPPAELRTRLDSKMETTRLGNEAGVASAPNILARADDYETLMQHANEAKLGNNLVVQTPYGDSGRTTFFIRDEDDWERHAAKMRGQDLKIMKYINHLPGTVEGCTTRHGTLVGPVMTDITGFEEITPYKGGWCGNDVSHQLLPDEVVTQVKEMVRKLGDRLWKEGYKGVFCCDFLLDTDDNTVYLGEVNPRISGASPVTNLITTTYGGLPLFLFHLLEYLDVDYDLDIDAVQARWQDYDNWSQLVLKQTEDKVELITHAPTSGIWRMDEDGSVEFERDAQQITSVSNEDEAFYLQVYGVGEYCYHGADLGILLTRGRMQTSERELLVRAKKWNAAIKSQFKSVPLEAEVSANVPDDVAKWF